MRTPRRLAIRTLCTALAACVLLPVGARAEETTATLSPSFSPNRHGASAALTLAFRFAGGSHGVPTPLSRMIVHLPAGLSINLRGVGTCSKSRLAARGPHGCPASSLLGSGHALLGAHLGSRTITEGVTLSAVRGPNQGGRPTLDISGQGLTPLDVRAVAVGVLQLDRPPYGSELVVSIPAIPTLQLEPNASTFAFSVTIGGAHARKVLKVPGSCPAGGLPFAANVTFADGSTGEASATASCS
jgi:hypothetical protein